MLSTHACERRISAEKKRHGGERARFVLPPLPQESGGYLSGVSDLLLGVRSQWGPRLQPLPLDSPVVQLLLQQEAQGGDEGVSVSGSAPPWGNTHSVLKE